MQSTVLANMDTCFSQEQINHDLNNVIEIRYA